METKKFWKYSLLFATVYFFSLNGLGALSNLSVLFLLKEKIRLSASQTAYFHALTLLSWVIKPLWGYLSDQFPLWGLRRRSYFQIMSVIAGFSWLALAMIPSYSVGLLLIFITLAYSAYAFQDVVTDAWMVEVGQPERLTGKFQSIQWGAVYLAMTITALWGGSLADQARQGTVPFQWIFAMAAIFPLMTLGVGFFTLDESAKSGPRSAHPVAWAEIFRSKEIWLLAFFLFLWTFSPAIGTPFIYYALDTLHFDGAFLGVLQALASVTAFVTSLVFAKWIDRIPVRKFLIAVVLTGSILLLSHLIYFMPTVYQNPQFARMLALVTRIPFAIFDTLVILTLLNLAAKICPRYAGGSVFALLMSFYNLGQSGADILGGFLFSLMGLPRLIVISAGFSFLTLLVLPFLAIPEPLTPIEKKMKQWFRPFVL